MPLTTQQADDALVLIVDDEPINRLLVENILKKGGFRQIASVDCGEAALAFVEERVPSCILLDIMMPGIDGYEVCRRLRADPRFAPIPIIIQTTLVRREDRREAFAAGASDVVAKPHDPSELVARVRVHVLNAVSSAGLLAYRTRMEAELAEARQLSEAVLPQAEALAGFARHGVVFSQFYRPSSTIGGDYWNVWELGPGKVALMVGDVSGHGVGAALRMFALHTLMTPPPPFNHDLRAMTSHLDARLHSYGHLQGQFVAGTYGVLDVAKGALRYSGGGLRDAVVARRDGDCALVHMSGLPLGVAVGFERDIHELRLDPGDTLILYSDALVESEVDDAPSSEEELLAWLKPLLATPSPPESLAERLAGRFLDAFAPGVTDDLLIVTATILG